MSRRRGGILRWPTLLRQSYGRGGGVGQGKGRRTRRSSPTWSGPSTHEPELFNEEPAAHLGRFGFTPHHPWLLLPCPPAPSAIPVRVAGAVGPAGVELIREAMRKAVVHLGWKVTMIGTRHGTMVVFSDTCEGTVPSSRTP